MLEEYIINYEKALAEKDWEEVSRIERELAGLGMDKITLSVIVAERKNGKSK